MASVVPTERQQTNKGDSSTPIVSDDGLLPTDVLRDILLRLPGKPLLRFRAVCRSWRSLLSDSSFVAAHKAREQPLVAVCKWEPWDPVEGYRVNPPDIRILDTSGHLVRQMRVENCVLGDHSNAVCTNLDLLCVEGGDKRLRVLDPATGAVSLLPDVIIANRSDRYQDTCYFTTYAVGRDGSTGETTKVLAIAQETLYTVYGTESFCSVLTLGDSGGWRETGYPPATVYASSLYTALVKGVLYFLGLQGIAAYDLDKEKWRPDLLHLPMPNEGGLLLAELSDSLVASYNRSDASMDLWFLADSDKVTSWSKQCTITMPYQAYPNYPRGGASLQQPLWTLDDGRIVFWAWKCCNGKRVEFTRVYDPAADTYTDGAEIGADYSFHAVYKGSLLTSCLDSKKLSMYPAVTV